MRPSRVFLWCAAGAVLVGAVVVEVDGLRWRAQLVVLKARGAIPELAWGELARMIRPRSGVYLRPLIVTRNPHMAIQNPDTSAADLQAGAEGFRGRCAACHGAGGRGGTAPPLVGGPLTHGGTDWGLYRVISYGIPGTGMPGFDIPDRDRWRIAAFVRALRANADSSAPAVLAPALERLATISAEQLVEARADSANWLTYSGAYDGRRYSTLSQVNRGNVQRLRLLWMHQTGEPDRIETTPLVVDGVMFLTTPTGGVRALDAETGTVLWSSGRQLPRKLSLCCGRMNRGLALLGSTLYLATLDAHLLALDARRGTVLWDVAAADPAQGYSFTSAPLVVKDMVVIGSAGAEYAIRGFIDAYDAATGKRRWRFYAVPEAGSPGSETWRGDSWKGGGGAPWLTGSYDPVLDLLYWGTGNPNPDYDGDSRLGDNLYTNSVVALDRATGALKWYFQFTPHDEHDWDAAQIPVLIDGPGPEARPLLLMANKNAFYYVLDRATGRFLRAREFVRQNWATAIDSTGRPMLRPGSAPSRAGSPAISAATNWWSPTYSPRTGAFYLQTFDRELVYFKGPSLPGRDPAWRLGGDQRPEFIGGGRGAIRALDALTGARRWEFETFRGSATYLEYVGGLLSTAGDLVFGAAKDVVLALDATDGRLLWSFNAGGGVHAAPITYLIRGRQRVTVAAGQALLTFGLQ